MTKRQKLILLFFITQSLFVGMGITYVFNNTHQDSWISVILGGFFGLLIIMTHQTILKKKKHKKITIILKEMGILGKFIRIGLLLFGLFIFIENLIIIQTYVTSFFLINTPFLAINIPIVFLVYLICQKGLPTIGRVAECLFPIAITLFLISFFCLIPYSEFNNFLPILETSPLLIIRTALFIAFITAAPSILMLEVDDNGQKMIKTYIFSMIILLAILIFILGDLGSALSESFRFPEYIVLKKIKIFNFIEKVENVLSIQWLLAILVSLSFSGFFIKKMLPEKRNNQWFILVLIGIVLLVSLVLAKEYITILFIKHYGGYIFMGLFSITSLILLYKTKNIKK